MQECWLKGKCNKNCPQGICIKKYKLNYILDLANVPISARKDIILRVDKNGTDLKAFKQLKEIQDNIVDFVQNGNSLYIHSSQAGNGKTSWSFKLLNSYVESVAEASALKCRALFINVPRFLISLKENISVKDEYIQNIKDNINTCDLVIWDDIGNKLATTYEADNLLNYIDNRITAGKANVFTSNLNDSELHQALGDRLASRICNRGINIEFFEGDKRNIKPQYNEGN